MQIPGGQRHSLQRRKKKRKKKEKARTHPLPQPNFENGEKLFKNEICVMPFIKGITNFEHLSKLLTVAKIIIIIKKTLDCSQQECHFNISSKERYQLYDSFKFSSTDRPYLH